MITVCEIRINTVNLKHNVKFVVKAVVPHVHHDHGKHHSNETDFELEHSAHDILSEKRAVWCGLTALSGIFLFFIVERLVGFCSEKRRIKHESQVSALNFF